MPIHHQMIPQADLNGAATEMRVHSEGSRPTEGGMEPRLWTEELESDPGEVGASDPRRSWVAKRRLGLVELRSRNQWLEARTAEVRRVQRFSSKEVNVGKITSQARAQRAIWNAGPTCTSKNACRGAGFCSLGVLSEFVTWEAQIKGRKMNGGFVEKSQVVCQSNEQEEMQKTGRDLMVFWWKSFVGFTSSM